MSTSIAFIIPCFNEESSIAEVVKEARQLFPGCDVYVCDNNSTDQTASVARCAGATVMLETSVGKGNAVRRLLRDVDADVFVMVDGDNTYGMDHLPQAVDRLLTGRYDLLTGDRFADPQRSMFRKGHHLGNKMFTRFFRFLFDIKTRDVFSGLRVLSRRLVKSLPLASDEFEVETELTIYAARMRLPVADFPTSLRQRVDSASKLKTYEDGFKILLFSLRLLHREYPVKLYSFISALLFAIGLSTALSIYIEFLATGLVARQPTLVVALFLLMISAMTFFSGLILKEVSNLKYEQRYLAYLDR